MSTFTLLLIPQVHPSCPPKKLSNRTHETPNLGERYVVLLQRDRRLFFRVSCFLTPPHQSLTTCKHPAHG